VIIKEKKRRYGENGEAQDIVEGGGERGSKILVEGNNLPDFSSNSFVMKSI